MEEEKFIKKIKFYVNSYDDFSPIEYQITFGNSVNKTLDAYIQAMDVECFTSIQTEDYTAFNKNISKIIYSWKHRYKTKEDICDGREWSLSIFYTDNKRTYYTGDIEEPENFEELVNYISAFCSKLLRGQNE